MSDRGSTNSLVPIMVALIGVAGSLGGAWMATGARFESKLKESQDAVSDVRGRVSQMTVALDSLRGAMATQVQTANKSIARLSDSLTATEQRNAQLQRDLAAVNVNIHTAQESVSAINRRAVLIRGEMMRTAQPLQPLRP
jgi:septal ring factor EnvC (AmiA/AmiB activator)